MLNERLRSDAKPFFFCGIWSCIPASPPNLASPPTPLRKERGVITTVGWIFLVVLLFKGIHHHPISNTYHPISNTYHPISNTHHPISNTYHPITNTPCRWVKEAFWGVEKVLNCGYQWRTYYHFGGWRMIYISIVNLIIFEDNCFAVLSFYVTFAGNIR